MEILNRGIYDHEHASPSPVQPSLYIGMKGLQFALFIIKHDSMCLELLSYFLYAREMMMYDPPFSHGDVGLLIKEPNKFSVLCFSYQDDELKDVEYQTKARTMLETSIL